MTKNKIVVLTGAGMSAESGIPTFRSTDGLWENHKIEDVASPMGWKKDYLKVLEFYNQRRKNILASEPNLGHRILAELQEDYDVEIITQNIDNLHERAGSKNVLHLHGEIIKSRSTVDSSVVYSIDGWQLNSGDLCELGSQLRPHIVWFGEDVPLYEKAIEICCTADIIVVVGTSLQVYPAAGLVHYASESSKKYVVDPNPPAAALIPNYCVLQEAASSGLLKLREMIRNSNSLLNN